MDKIQAWGQAFLRLHLKGLPRGSDGKESACNPGDLDLIPEEGTGYQLQYSCLENSMDRGAWWPTVHGVTKSQTWLSDWHTQKDRWRFLQEAKRKTCNARKRTTRLPIWETCLVTSKESRPLTRPRATGSGNTDDDSCLSVAALALRWS